MKPGQVRRGVWNTNGARYRYASAYLLGAICRARKVGAAIIMPTVNTEAMTEHLKEINTQVATGAHAVVVCDGAGGHPMLPAVAVCDGRRGHRD